MSPRAAAHGFIVAGALLAAHPAAAQAVSLPEWLLGEWCPPDLLDKIQPPPSVPQSYVDPARPSGSWYGPGPTCLLWTRAEDGLFRGVFEMRFSGIPDQVTTLEIKAGRRGLRYRTRTRQWPQHPVRWSGWYAQRPSQGDELVFVLRDWKVRIRREGDRLLVSNDGGEPYVYVRHARAGTGAGS